MFEDSKSKVFWFAVALTAVGLVTGIIVASLVDLSNVIQFLRSVERY